jgi:hypothetical protein
MTRFDPRELPKLNYMREAEAALQIASERVATRDDRRRELVNAPNGSTPPPDSRILRILADSSREASCHAGPEDPASSMEAGNGAGVWLIVSNLHAEQICQ